jgi:peptidoglycan/xylan/chitin deacetylase (PgdA/CDA1 family)
MNRVMKTYYKLRRQVSYAYRDTIALTGLDRGFFRKARGATIVVYHGICADDPFRFNNIFITRNAFEEHLRFYREYFHILSLDDYFQGRFDPDRFNVCIHFDDGYATNYTQVLPLLDQYQVPATFCITAIREAGYDILWNDFLGLLNKFGPAKIDSFHKLRAGYVSESTGLGFWETFRPEGFEPKAELINTYYPSLPLSGQEDYWLQMTEDQIRLLAASDLVTIAAHGYYHNDLARIDLAAAEDEIRGSKQFLERTTGKEVKAFAFPYGTYTPAVVDAAKRAGFNQLLALKFLGPEDATIRERFIINPYVSLTNQMYNVVRKRYDFWR